MSNTNTIRSLYRTDNATAGVIMQQCPPQWDMDRVFRKAYQGYLAQKQESVQTEMPFCSELTETVEYTTEHRISHRIRRIGGYAGLAAAMLGVFLLVAKVSSLRTPVDNIPGETDHTTTADSAETTHAAETTFPETTVVSGQLMTMTTSAPTETTTAEPHSTETSTQTAGAGTETAVHVTEPAASGMAVPDTTGTSVTTTEMTTESTQETTTETTTAPPVIPQGQFVVGEQSGSLYQVTYVRENAVPVEEHEHSFAADGFTITGVMEQNPDYDFRSVIYNLEDAAGQHYMVQQFRYDYFMTSFNPEYYPLTRSYTIGGKSVFLIYQDDPEAVCNLMWDDGCHICMMTSQYKDLAQMELLAQGQIIQ